ncbi:MAG: hypothetical protein QNK19_16850 [Xanthomonadales bacterium]|nr:hypothetical protein [Xanthomonadales bacterium]
MLSSVIQGGVNEGMCAMDDSLAKLLRKGTITARAALNQGKGKVPIHRHVSTGISIQTQL